MPERRQSHQLGLNGSFKAIEIQASTSGEVEYEKDTPPYGIRTFVVAAVKPGRASYKGLI